MLSSLIPLLFLPLLGGALFCRRAHRFKYSFYRRSGYELFFQAAAVGAILLLIASVLVREIPDVPCIEGYPCLRASTVQDYWTAYTPDVPFLGTCFVSFILGIPAAKLANLLDLRSERELKNREIRTHGTELEILAVNAVESLREANQVRDAPMHALTLRNGKVFIGFINAAPVWPSQTSYLRMIKLASGYRDSTRDIVVESRYDHLIETGPKDTETSRKKLAQLGYNAPKTSPISHLMGRDEATEIDDMEGEDSDPETGDGDADVKSDDPDTENGEEPEGDNVEVEGNEPETEDNDEEMESTDAEAKSSDEDSDAGTEISGLERKIGSVTCWITRFASTTLGRIRHLRSPDQETEESDEDISDFVASVERVDWHFIPSDFEVILPFSEIVHISPFEKQAHHPEPDENLDWDLTSSTSTFSVSTDYR